MNKQFNIHINPRDIKNEIQNHSLYINHIL